MTLPVGRTTGARQGGFTYVMVLISVAVVGIAGGVSAELISTQLKMEREAELLFRGGAYRRAIASYYGSNGYFPRNLEQLLSDRRSPVQKRHLRALYPEPIQKEAWLLIRSIDGGIAGVASPSKEKPGKQGGFGEKQQHFAEAEEYSQWEFVFRPLSPMQAVPRAQY